MASEAGTREARVLRVDPESLRGFAAAILRDLGMSDADAETGGRVLVKTDLRGTHSHGIRYLPTYVPLFRGGAINPTATLEVVEESPGATVADANAGMGHVMAHRAAELAIRKALTGPARTALVLVRNSNHFGAASYYSLMCAEAGVIGLVFTNSAPVMAAAGSRGSVLTNAPFSYGIPGPDGHHVVFDAALSHVAGSRIMMAQERGEDIPLGWLVDAAGLPTADPAHYFRGGALAPIGAHKGYAIALLVEILAGVLSGAGITHEVRRFRAFPDTPSQTGHAMIAIDLEALMPRERFLERMRRLRDEIHGAAPAADAERVLLPGELEEEHEAESLANGLELDGVIWQGLRDVAAEFGRADRLEQSVVS